MDAFDVGIGASMFTTTTISMSKITHHDHVTQMRELAAPLQTYSQRLSINHS